MRPAIPLQLPSAFPRPFQPAQAVCCIPQCPDYAAFGAARVRADCQVMSAAPDASSCGCANQEVHVTAIMASATRALAIETFGINGAGRGAFDRFIAGDDAITAASASVSAARLARMALRTWIVDRWLLNASCSCSQVVLMGAGLDTRCFSLPLPPVTRLFELDLPVVIGLKSHLLSSSTSPCSVFRVPCDLSHSSWAKLLQDAGFRRDRTAWLFEGTAMCAASREFPFEIVTLFQVSPTRSCLLSTAAHARKWLRRIAPDAALHAPPPP
jgi:O-methyltransferase involved in polyketide biosynthesis